MQKVKEFKEEGKCFLVNVKTVITQYSNVVAYWSQL